MLKAAYFYNIVQVKCDPGIPVLSSLIACFIWSVIPNFQQWKYLAIADFKKR